MTRSSKPASICLALGSAALAGCGGGDDPPPAPPLDLSARIAAATATAQGNAACHTIRPFYWEVGDKDGARASGSVGGTTYTASTAMPVASATKWIYAAYVAERRGTAGLTGADIQFLNFRSGYRSMGALSCGGAATVADCLNTGSNGTYSPSSDGRFFYNGGHMQRHAVDLGLGALSAAALTAEVQARIGDFGFTFAQPQPPGGVNTTAAGYAAFLRKMLRGELRIAGLLGSHAVCTQPATCPGQAQSTPVPAAESWQYGIGHWLETDPAVGDGAFSSAGAFGFYPWIDRGKAWYGVIARHDTRLVGGEGAGFESGSCGRLIRKAWLAGAAQ